MNYAGSSLILNGKTSLRHYFSVETGYSIDDFYFRIAGKRVAPIKVDNNLYYVLVENIPANELSKTYMVIVNGSYGLEYSAMSYAYKASIQNSDESLRTLAYALNDLNKKASALIR